MHPNVYELRKSKKKKVNVRMKFAQPWYGIQEIIDLMRHCFPFIIVPFKRHYLHIFGFDYNYECTIDKKKLYKGNLYS